MKSNFLFCLLAIAAVVTGCRKVDPTPDQPEQNDLIRLNSGVSNVLISKAEGASTPERTDAGFLANDEIGVTAVFSKKQAVSEQESDEPSWGLDVANRHFTNVKAIASGPVTPAVSGSYTNEFAWVTDNAQYYPQGRNIFLYAYYPYHDGSAEAVKGVSFKKASSTSTADPIERDSLVVTLQPETITDIAQTLTQPDVMVASHAKATAQTPASISRVSPEAETRLVFRHLLSQLQFSIWKEKEVKGDTKFKSLTVYVPPTGSFAVGGTTDDLALAPVPMTEGSNEIDYSKFVKYTLAYTPGTVMPIKGDVDVEPQILMEPGAGYTPFMTFPLTLAQLNAGYIKIELVVDLGGSYGEKKFEIPASAFTKALIQGATNTINFTVNYVLVTVTASVTPWATNPDINEIPIE